MKIIGVNGIETDGSGTTDRIIRLVSRRLDHMEYFDFNYEKVRWFQARSRTVQNRIGQQLANESDEGDIVICHSFGALVTLRAMERGAQFSTVVMLAAAMNRDFVFPAWGAESIVNLYHREDRALTAGGLLPEHDFGKMGKNGYKFAKFDDRFVDVDMTGTLKKGQEPLPIHSAYFNEDNIDTVVELIAPIIETTLTV